MQIVSSNLLNKLRANTKKLVKVAEFYHQDAVPGENGFDPSGDDCLLRVSALQNVSFRGETYYQLVARGGFGRFSKTIKKTLSGGSVTLSNSTREIYDFESLIGFEGLICVIREFDRNYTTNLNDSYVIFTGRCEAVDDFQKSSETARVNIKQILNQTEKIIPRRKFTNDDILGRSPSDLEFEGFRYTPRTGSVNYNEKVKSTGILGLIGFKKTVTRTMQYSSHSDVKEETCVPVVLGRVQSKMINFASIDKGTWIEFIGFWADGHEYGIKAVENIRSLTEGFYLPSIATKLGKKGGLVDDATHQGNDDPSFVFAGIYSRSAYSRAIAKGTTLESDDSAPEVAGNLIGQILPIPDSSNQFTRLEPSDNAVAQSRWALSSQYYFNLSSSFLSDADDLEAYNYNEHILIDTQNTDTVLLNQNQTTYAGNQYKIYQSTGKLSPDYYKALSGDSYSPIYQQEADYQFYDDVPYNSDDPSGTGTPSLPPTTFRRRYTSNVQILEEMKLIDFLFDILLASSNLYLVQKANGKIAHKHKKPVDFTFVKTANAVGASEIAVKNVNAWVGKNSLILIGANLPHSEVRRITGYRFETNPSISISASGGVSASNSTLTGGSNTVAPNATLTVSDATGVKTIVIAGFTLTYSASASDTTVTVAGMVAGMINSHNELNKIVKAVWTPNTSTVAVSSRLGFLTLDTPLQSAHLTEIANPSSPPSLTATTGNLLAGKYQVCYSYVTMEGETLTSPITEITLTNNQAITTPTITKPSRVIAIKWYCSVEANGVRRKLINTNDGQSFTINELPKLDNQLEPVFNATAEELHHIDLAFTDKKNTRSNLTRSNMLKGSFSFPKGGKASNINQIKIKFPDAAADYKITTLIVNDYIKQAKTKKVNSLEINGAAIDNEHQARRIANSKLAELCDGDKFYGFASDNEALLLEEGDVICVTDESGRLVNEPARIEEIDIEDASGYSQATFTARKYRRYFYDDQVQERLVPLPIIQNNAINREQVAPVIYVSGELNQSVQVGIRNYSTTPYFRKIEVSSSNTFPSDSSTKVIIHNAANEVGFILKEFFDISRTTNLSSSETVYIRVSHSSNGETWGELSNVVTAVYPAPPTPPADAPPVITSASYASGVMNILFNPGDGTGQYTTEYNLGAGWVQIVNNLDASTTIFTHTIAQTSTEQSVSYRLKRNDKAIYSSAFDTTIPATSSTPPSSGSGTGTGGSEPPPPTGGSGGTGGCFVGETLFWLSEAKAIPFAELYDDQAKYLRKYILSSSDALTRFNSILRGVSRRESFEIATLCFVSGEKLRQTKEHRFFTENKEWKSVKDLSIGEKVWCLGETWQLLEVKSVKNKVLKNPVFVYNCEIDVMKSYFVGEARIKVHNRKPAPGDDLPFE